MLFLKACPKCRGDLQLDRDVYGIIECLQCGLLKDVEPSEVANDYRIPHLVGELLAGQSQFLRLSA